MRLFLIVTSVAALALPAAAAPLAPLAPTSLQTVLKQGASTSFRFEAQPTQLDTASGPLPYSQMGAIDYACTNGSGEGATGSIGWEAPAAPGVATFGAGKGLLAVTTAVVGHQVELTVSNKGGGYYCLVRVWSPGAEVP